MAAPERLHGAPDEAQDMIAFERWINEGGRIREDRDASRPVMRTPVRSGGRGIEPWASRPLAARGPIDGGSLRDPRDAHVGHGSDAEDATTQASSWSSPNTLGFRYRAPSAGSPCGDVLAHDRHAVDVLPDRVAAGSRRTCVDVLDLAAC